MAADPGRRFGPYRIDLTQRVLLRDGSPVALTPRAFDVLATLINNAGRIVSKDELMQAVWGKSIVEEGTLNWQVFALRQKLAEAGDDQSYIETVPKRGYRFVATLLSDEHVPTAPALRTGRRRWIAAAAAAAACGLVIGAVWWLRPADPVLPYAERDWLLVTDFENQTGDPRFDQALLTAFVVSLEQSKYVNVLSRERVASTLERMRKLPHTRIDEAVAREICARENIRALVAPTVTRSGREYALAARLIDPATGNTVKSYLIRTEDEDGILRAVQETAARVRRDLGETVAAVRANNRALSQVTTSVLAALQQYSEGVALARQAKIPAAIESFKAAIAADPEFAMAHAALGRLHYGPAINRPDLGAEYFQRAIAQSARVTERERMLIAANFAMHRGQTAPALKLYATYLAGYPDDPDIHNRVGDLYASAGRFADAVASFDAALNVDPTNLNTLNSIAAASANRGEFKQALVYMRRAVDLDKSVLDRFNFRFNYSMILLGSGDSRQARELLLAAPPGLVYRAQRALGLIEQYNGRYRAAAEHFSAAVAASAGNSELHLSLARDHGFLAATLAAQGDRRRALAQLRLATLSLDRHGRASLEFRARIAKAFARLGDLDAAAAQQRLVNAEADANNVRHQQVVQQLTGELELARGRASEALEMIDAANRLQSQIESPLVLDSLARAAIAANNSDRAIAALQQLISIKGQWLGWEAQEPWLLAHLELAVLYRDTGQLRQARRLLDTFLARWKSADRDLPVMAAALQLDTQLPAIR